MSKKLFLLASFAFLLALVNSAAATDVNWTSDSPWSVLFSDPLNWDPVVVPGPGDNAIIDLPNSPCWLDSDASCDNLTVGLNNADCSLNMISGSLSVGTDFTVGDSAGSAGTFSVSDGSTVRVDGHLEIGGPMGCVGHVQLVTGTISTGTFGMRSGGGIGTMEIGGGGTLCGRHRWVSSGDHQRLCV